MKKAQNFDPFKNLVLDKYEQEIEDALDTDKIVSVPNLEEEKERFALIAKNTTQKKRNINLRVTEKTLDKLKAKAIAEGMPYQTLASSILHKYANK